MLTSLGIGIGLTVGALHAQAAPHPMKGGDIAADAKWGACINIEATESSEVFEFLSQTIAHERLDQLAGRARNEWSLDLASLKTISIYGADDDWATVTVVARGDFSGVDLWSAPSQDEIPRHGSYSIHRYAPLDHITLWFAKHADDVLVAGDTVKAVKRALDMLDTKQGAHPGVADQPEAIRKQLASSVCVMGLDVEKLKRELDLQSLLFAGTSQAWFVLREENGEARAQLLMDHASGESAAETVTKLEHIVQAAFETRTTPAVIAEFLEALTTRTEGRWIIASAAGSSDEMVHLLGGLQELLRVD